MNKEIDNQATLDNLFHDLWPTINIVAKATINEVTRQSYSRVYEALASRIDYENGITLSDTLSESKRKNTYYLRLAACRYTVVSKLMREYEKARTAIRTNESDTFRQCESTIHKLKCELAEVNGMPPSSKVKVMKSRKSKRSSLSGLPGDWRKLLCYRMISSKYFFQTLALAICGCRPLEMKLGILIKTVVVEKNEQLVIEIRGAKVTNENGQKFRHLTFSADASNPFLSPLINLVKEMGGSTSLNIQNEKAFSSAITRFAEELWPRHKEPITPYSFRHAFASDMKRYADEDTVAQSLGHRSTRTQKTYGQKQLSRSSDHPRPVEVLAPFPARKKITRFSKTKTPLIDHGLTGGC